MRTGSRPIRSPRCATPGASCATRVRAKVEMSKSAALPQREFGTAADWQLRQALAALAGRPVQTVAAPAQLMPAQPACERGDD
jgi:carboxyl-terminal processing protease